MGVACFFGLCTTALLVFCPRLGPFLPRSFFLRRFLSNITNGSRLQFKEVCHAPFYCKVSNSFPPPVSQSRSYQQILTPRTTKKYPPNSWSIKPANRHFHITAGNGPYPRLLDNGTTPAPPPMRKINLFECARLKGPGSPWIRRASVPCQGATSCES